MQNDVDYVAKWLASRYTLAKPAEKQGLTDALVIALEGASQPTRDAICNMLGIIYVYPGEQGQRVDLERPGPRLTS